MFVYASSHQKKRFYSMITLEQWEKLLDLVGVERVERFKEMPQTYIYLVFVLTNYTSYSCWPE